MQHHSKQGVYCDFCHILYKEDFDYHSLDVKKITVYNNIRPSLGEMLNTKVVDSFDVCTECMEDLRFKVVDNYSKLYKSGVFCEVSGEKLSGSYRFFYVVAVDVSVNMSKQPFVCVKCGKKSFNNSQCSCGCDDFRRSAVVVSGHRDLEISISEAVYNGWKEEKSKQKTSNWASSS